MNAPLRAVTSVRALDWNDGRGLARITGFLDEQGASLFQRPPWLRAVAAGTGQRAVGLLAERRGEVTGWLPLTAVRSALFGDALVSSGFAVGGGICAADPEAARALAAAAEDHALRGGFATIELRGGPMPEGWASWDDRHCGFARPLAPDDAAELAAIPRKARAEVRKGLALGHRVTIGCSRADRAAHHACYSASLRNLGTPVFPRALFAAMLEAHPDSSDILTVWDGETPLASVLSFYHAGAVMPFWGGGVAAARAARANEVMYFALMRHARARGMTRFDFGRSRTGSGPYHFKRHWGFAPEPLTYCRWTAPGAQPRNLDPADAGYSRRIALWKRLPLPLANLVGPWIARGLA